MVHVRHIVVMGVAGCGKTTVAGLLAERLGWASAEADEFHPPANIAKITAGEPLTDEDRWPWLRAIRDWTRSQGDAGASTVVTCSALRRSYRDVLRGAGRLTFVHLSGDAEEISARMSERAHHFMPVSLLSSQFATLEPLEPDEDGITVSIAGTPAAIADAIIDALREDGGSGGSSTVLSPPR